MVDDSAPASTAIKAVAAALLRHLLTACGTAMVARGYLTQATADSATGPIAEYVLGAGLALSSAAWGALRARLMQTRWAQAWIAPARQL